MVELIAEIASNHGGDLSLAKEFVRRFVEAGAHTVKFQATRVKHLRPDDPQYDWFTKAELSDDALAELKAECETVGAGFLLTIYHVDEIALLKKLGCARGKLGAGEASDHGLRSAVALAGLRAVRSVPLVSPRAWPGPPMANEYLLACVCRYPASQRACLAAISHIGRVDYNVVRGYSDHSVGLEMAEWAIECGAQILEKHVMLEHQARPPRAFEASVDEIKQLRRFIDEGPERFQGRWQFA